MKLLAWFYSYKKDWLCKIYLVKRLRLFNLCDLGQNFDIFLPLLARRINNLFWNRRKDVGQFVDLISYLDFTQDLVWWECHRATSSCQFRSAQEIRQHVWLWLQGNGYCWGTQITDSSLAEHQKTCLTSITKRHNSQYKCYSTCSRNEIFTYFWKSDHLVQTG